MDLVRLKHDNVIELPLRSISKAYKHKGLQGEVPLAQRCGEAVCTAHDPMELGTAEFTAFGGSKCCVYTVKRNGAGVGAAFAFYGSMGT